MMDGGLTGRALAHWLVDFAAWLVCGALIGGCYFATLRWNVRLIVARRSVLLPLSIQLGRLLGVAAVLMIIAKISGAAPLVAAAAGIVAARAVVTRSAQLSD